MTKKIPIGVDDFLELSSKENNFLFIDKTLFIKELLDDGVKISLIIRPRRWGKTLNLSMLQYFFSPEVQGHPTQGLFDHLKIAKENNGAYLKHQGQHPVILISFKDVKEYSFDDFITNISVLVENLYRDHSDIFSKSENISQEQKKMYSRIINRQSNKADLKNSLNFLSECLEKHYNKKVIILIDEYDTPLNIAYSKDYFEQAVNFFKSLFGSSLKGNKSLHKGFITGILRLYKNSMLSDLNNLVVYSFMDKQYSQHFGFSDAEVIQLFTESGVPLDLPAVQKWYNGYRSGNFMDIYNPWSILNCINNQGLLKPYWIKTGDEALLNKIFMESGASIKEKINQLIIGNSIESLIDDYVSFDQMQSGKEQVLWSLLWTLGYLKTVGEPTQLGSLNLYHLKIPNYEVGTSYRNGFIEFISSLAQVNQYKNCLSHLIIGKVDLFVEELRAFMLKNVSYFDCTSESNYHMLLLGMSAYLIETHTVLSNREQGMGRPDLIFIPNDQKNNLGIILEFKRAESGKSNQFYEKIAESGLAQISEKYYDVRLRTQPSIKKILKLCLVFHGKTLTAQFIIEDIE